MNVISLRVTYRLHVAGTYPAGFCLGRPPVVSAAPCADASYRPPPLRGGRRDARTALSKLVRPIRQIAVSPVVDGRNGPRGRTAVAAQALDCHRASSSDSGLSFRRPARHDRVTGQCADGARGTIFRRRSRLPRHCPSTTAIRGAHARDETPILSAWRPCRNRSCRSIHLLQRAGLTHRAYARTASRFRRRAEKIRACPEPGLNIGLSSFPRKTHPKSPYRCRSQLCGRALRSLGSPARLPGSIFDATSFPRKTGPDVTKNSACRRVDCSL
jgi:hypothetical protein